MPAMFFMFLEIRFEWDPRVMYYFIFVFDLIFLTPYVKLVFCQKCYASDLKLKFRKGIFSHSLSLEFNLVYFSLRSELIFEPHITPARGS